jgi:DNA-binding transcriptional MerR regulator
LPKVHLTSDSNRKAASPKKPSEAVSRKSPVRVEESLRIGDVARLLGISPSMVRAWEKLGLARPARTDTRYRIYTNGDVKALRRAVYLRRVQGLNAPAILRQLREEGLLGERESAPPSASPLGPKLRRMRLQRGEPLSKVAEAVGVSIGFLSSVERAQSEASLSVLHRLAEYYGLDIRDFFNPISGTTPLVRPPDRKVLLSGPGVRMELLASGKITMEPHLIHIAPGVGSGDSYTHKGEEFLFIVRGRLVIALEDQEYDLRTGDSFYFGSHIRHHWQNPGKAETVILWVNTPPSF